MSDANPPSARPPISSEFAQTTPKGARSYDEMNTGTMVFELQGTVGELKESIANLTRTVEQGFARIDSTEKTSSDIKEILRLLVPKLENLTGFTTHRAPHLADKTDIANLKSELSAEIQRRPTRRQSITDVTFIVSLITAAMTFGSKLAH